MEQGKTHRFWKKASELGRDPRRVEEFLNDAESRANRHRHHLAGLWESLKAMIRLLRAWAVGEYRDVPWRTILSSIGALLYLVNPIDLIPDFLIGGLIDDALVLGWVLTSIRTDLDRFLEWEVGR